MKRNKMVSIIVPTYNRAALVKRTIMSIINQTYQEIEIIVVDDGSTDDTEEVVLSIDYDNLKYIKQVNSGACVARNRGIKEAKGEVIAFLDSDDEWYPEKLEMHMRHFDQCGGKVSVCNYMIEKNGEEKKGVPNGHSDCFTYDELLDHNYITTGSIIIDKEFLIQIGGFDTKMPRYQDWELVLRISKEMDIPFCSEPLMVLHSQDVSITNSTSKEKKYYALVRMLKKNKREYEANSKAYAHICWSIGMYSLFMEKKRKDCLRLGVFHGGINMKRLFIFICICLFNEKMIMKKYGATH